MWVAQDLAILERPGLAFVGVGDDVPRARGRGSHQGPFAAGGKRGAPHALEPRLPEHFGQVLGFALERAPQGPITRPGLRVRIGFLPGSRRVGRRFRAVLGGGDDVVRDGRLQGDASDGGGRGTRGER